VSPVEYVNTIMAGVGVILQFGRSYGMKLRHAVIALTVIATLLAVGVSDPLVQIFAGAKGFKVWQDFMLQWLMQFVGIISSGLGGLFATSGAAHSMVAAGANADSPLVPITKQVEVPGA